VGLVAPLALAAVLIPFRDSFPNTDAALALVLVVVAVAAAGRRLAGVVAAVSAAAWFDLFLTVPYGRVVAAGLTLGHRADWERERRSSRNSADGSHRAGPRVLPLAWPSGVRAGSCASGACLLKGLRGPRGGCRG